MPLYDLMCSCGYTKEYILRLNEQEPVCDKCGLRMSRAMSAPAFILNGKNWYKDGYGLHTDKKKKGGPKKNA